VAGGMIGTTLRGLVGVSSPSAFPWRTLMVNLFGTAVLGVLIGRVEARPEMSRWVPLVGVGVMGSLTTFGTMMVELVDLTRAGAIGMAIAYSLISLGMGSAIGLAGLRLGETRKGPHRWSES
jgi:fluoride exporter